MTQVSRYPLNKKVEKRITEIFLQTFTKLKNEFEAATFFEEFLTPTEKTVLSKRITIAVLLAKGYNYSTIRQILRVTPSTIARTSLIFKHKGVMVNKIVSSILKEEKWNIFWEEVAYLIEKATMYQKGVSWRRRRTEIEYQHRINKKPF